ncbi:MAG: hypothetical protein HQL24_04175 [Candidatus Omnitrophica bacterium]|nr:hypothetical protein [Candidatus Omnitrophota bacterium]
MRAHFIFSHLASSKKAQSAFEYMLLLAVVVCIVLVGLKTYVPRTTQAANIYFDKTVNGIMGDAPRNLDISGN